MSRLCCACVAHSRLRCTSVGEVAETQRAAERDPQIPLRGFLGGGSGETIRVVKPFRVVPRTRVPGDLEQPEAASLQDGVFSRSQARAEGWSDGRQRRLLASGIWIAVTPTVVRNRGIDDGPWPRARAVALSGLIVSHHTAGQLLGLALGDGGAVLHGTCHGWHRPKVPRAHRARLAPDERFTVAGVEVTSVRRTIGDILRSQPPEKSIAMVTDALRRGLVSVADLSDIAGSLAGRHGAANARAVARSCSERPFSVLEWRFHGLIRELGPGWGFNVEVHDEDGLVGVVDAVHWASRTVVELDGRAYHADERFQSDRTRDQRLSALGFVVIRLTWDDVTRRSGEIMKRLVRTVARRTPAA